MPSSLTAPFPARDNSPPCTPRPSRPLTPNQLTLQGTSPFFLAMLPEINSYIVDVGELSTTTSYIYCVCVCVCVFQRESERERAMVDLEFLEGDI